jgi:hypothetical protein
MNSQVIQIYTGLPEGSHVYEAQGHRRVRRPGDIRSTGGQIL